MKPRIISKTFCPALLLTTLSIVLAPVHAHGEQSKAAIIGAAQKSLQSLHSAAGEFKQIGPNNSTASGKFFLRRPGKLRFEYTKNNPILIVSDGTTLVIQNKRLKTFDRIPLSVTPLSLFLGETINFNRPGLVLDVYDSGPSCAIKLGDPDKKIEGSVTLIFSKPDYRLKGWEVKDGAGQITRVALKKIKSPARLSASLFRIEDPEDEDSRDR